MGWFILAQLFSILIALVSLGRLSEREKDLEILLLRQQISILLRNRDQPVRVTQVEKLTLAIFTAKLKELTNRSVKELGEIILLFQPETVLRWHRELVRRKCTYSHIIQNKKVLGGIINAYYRSPSPPPMLFN